MNISLPRMLLVALISVLVVPVEAEDVWGSFDETRIHYSCGVLTDGCAYDDLREIIATNGGMLAENTSLLTTQYLEGIDVFYTSMLRFAGDGNLSDEEQDALHQWIAGGGTLIVSADEFSLAAFWSFTWFYGINNYVSVNTSGYGSIVASHPITAGVESVRYAGESTFSFGFDAQLLATNIKDDPFMVVLEPETGFDDGGRILVFADHNIFTDLFPDDNTQLAINVVRWANKEPILILGDLDCDGTVNLADVPLFVNAISTGDYDPKGDVNRDGVVDLLDVSPFVDLLTGG